MSTTLNTRVQSKRDTSANWTQNNPVLLDGEVIVVDTNSGDVRFKVGNGTSTYTQLPFQDEYIQNSITDVNNNLTSHEQNYNNPHQVDKVDVGLGNVANVLQYSANNPPPYPVTSVNGNTGAVNLTADDVGALSTSGGTLTGNLTGRYLTGTWLQSTAVTNYGSNSYKGICMFDGSGWVYYRTPSQILSDIGAAEASVQFSGTLPTSSWVSSSGNYYYQVNISGITSDSIPLVYPQWTTNRTNEQNSWNNLLYIQTFNGYVRFYSSSAFTTSVSYILLYNI